MNIKSLFLGSVAAVGLSTGAFAADAAVLTALDVCDSLGISGLTISSDTNCLQISGAVTYEFNWGDFNGVVPLFGPFAFDPTANFAAAEDDGAGVATQDWSGDLDAFVRFVATADSDFGPAKTVVKIRSRTKYSVTNEAAPVPHGDSTGVDDMGDAVFDEAYVSIGDGTVLSVGQKGSIINKSDDEPFDFALFHSDGVDKGVLWSTAVSVADGGHVIQLEHALGDGLILKAGLENLQGDGTAVGVIEYSGDNFTGHATVIANDVLDGAVTSWAYHAAGTAKMDMLRLRAALAGDSSGYWNGLASAEATFDLFTLAFSVEGAHSPAIPAEQFGFAGGVQAKLNDVVTVKGGMRWFDPNTAISNDEGWQAAIGLIASITETVTATGEVGYYGTGSAALASNASVTYGKAELAWAPGGGFATSIAGELNSYGGYKITYKASKSFR